MPDLSAIELARIQFGFTIAFHIVYPAFSIGLASYLATLNGLALWTGDSALMSAVNDLGADFRPLCEAVPSHRAKVEAGPEGRR